MNNDCIQLLESELPDIFQRFYDNILSDEHLAVYFEDMQQVRNLIKKQTQNMQNVLGSNPSRMQETYYHLGEKHHTMQIPLSAVQHSFQFLQRELIKTPNFSRHCDPLELIDLISLLLQHFSQGYFESETLSFYPILDLLHDYARDTKMLKEHISWFFTLLQAVEKKDENQLGHDTVNSKLKGDYFSLEFDNILSNKEDLNEISRINSEIHDLTSMLFYYIGKEDYNQAFNIFSNLKEFFLLFVQLLGSLERINTIQNLTYDDLTGLLVRRDLTYLFENQIMAADRLNKNIAVIMADIDYFKKVNDNFGHGAGDCVLKKFADIILDNIRVTDHAFRYGGEEFLLLLYGADSKKAWDITERIRTTVYNTDIYYQDYKLNITCSFGVTMYKPNDYSDSNTLIALADKNLYKAKEQGRNRVVSD